MKGVIAATTPSGWRLTIAMRPAPCGAESSAGASPWMRTASAADASSVRIARSTSPRAYRTGLPPSSRIAAANTSARSRNSTAARASAVARACAGIAAIAGAAAVADASAASRCSGPATATRATTRPSKGERTSRHRTASIARPPMRRGIGCMIATVEPVPSRRSRPGRRLDGRTLFARPSGANQAFGGSSLMKTLPST